MTTNTNGFLAQLPYMLNSREFAEGLILGLQEDPTEANSNCFLTYTSVMDLIETSNLNFYHYKYSTEQSGSTATDAGYISHLFVFLNEFSLIWFNLFADCYIENFFISLGRIFNNPSLAGNFAIAIVYEMIEYYTLSEGLSYTLE